MPGRKSTRHIDLTGHRFGRLTVIAEASPYFSPLRHAEHKRWLCKCDCGETTIVVQGSLRNGYTRSCGCFRKEQSTKPRSHGYRNSSTYASWFNMKVRCGLTGYKNKPDSNVYRNYEARGITVCKRWLKFESFLADMGPAPGPGFSIERVNNNLGYRPSNCKWIPRGEQAKNQSKSIRLTFNGEMKILADWARSLHLNYGTLISRIRRGWSIKQAFTTPVHY